MDERSDKETMSGSGGDAKGVPPELAPWRPALLGEAPPLLSFRPSLTNIFAGVAEYEPQSDRSRASLIDLATCVCLCRDNNASDLLRDAFYLMDGDNGRKDSKLSLSETKRILCALLVVVREVCGGGRRERRAGGAREPRCATAGVACARVAPACSPCPLPTAPRLMSRVSFAV